MFVTRKFERDFASLVATILRNPDLPMPVPLSVHSPPHVCALLNFERVTACRCVVSHGFVRTRAIADVVRNTVAAVVEDGEDSRNVGR